MKVLASEFVTRLYPVFIFKSMLLNGAVRPLYSRWKFKGIT